jgi:multiple sugar transport system permease protein
MSSEITTPPVPAPADVTSEGVEVTRTRIGRIGSIIGSHDPERFASALVTPAQLILLFIIAFPLALEVYLSLTDWSPTLGGRWWEAHRFWSWGQQYLTVLRDGAFWSSMWRTALIVGIAVPLEFLLGLGLAFLFLEEFRFKRFFHSILLTPMMIVPAVVGYMFFMILQSNGPVNDVLTMLAGTQVQIPWLTHQTLAMVSVIMAEVWQWTPLMFLILLSGLVGLPEDQMEAATMLGASFWQKFRYLMLPMLKPIIIIALIIRGMEAVKIFDLVFLMTGGGPARATETISIFMYKSAFLNIRWAFTAAVAIIVLVIMTIIAAYALRPLQVSQETPLDAAAER